MVDWARITADVEHILTLDGDARSEFMASLSGEDEQSAAAHLLRRAQPAAGFLSTSAPEDLVEDETLANGTKVGPWKIENHIGRGGMGDVYRASRADGLYDQTVALKLIQGLSPARAALFDAERRRLALMDHPGIARIIDGGALADGRPYMAMDFVDGTPMSDYAKARSLTRSARLGLFRAVCEAVGHAHGKLILHRDIKSENVLVDRDANPRLIDFGIASDLEDETRAGGPLTLATAAPEQLKGEPVSVQTDIFALGVLLHELLNGQRPERTSDGGMETDTEALANADLAAILSRALATDPTARYGSAAELGEDISAFLDKRPVSARQGGWLDAASKFIQRYPLASGLAAAVSVSLVAGLTTSLNFAAEARAEAERATEALAEAEANLERAQYFRDRSELFLGIQRTYSNLQQAMYGSDGDVERQTRIFLERWREAHALSESEPETASEVSYAVGRHFLFRNDYPTAIEVLSGWTEGGYGPPELVQRGRHLLAIAFLNSGRQQEALPLLREAEAWRSSGYEAGLADHIATASQIASITRAREDIERAEALLLNGIESHEGAYVLAYYWQRIARLREMRGDFQGALDARLVELEIIENDLQLNVEGADSSRLGLAQYELFFNRDPERAGEQIDRVIRFAEEVKGESRELGVAYMFRALILAEAGAVEQARSLMEESIALLERFSGPAAQSTLRARIKLAEVAALSDPQEAEALVAALAPDIAASGNSILETRLALASVLVTFHAEGIDKARAAYAASGIDEALLKTSLDLHAALENLRSLGVVEI